MRRSALPAAALLALAACAGDAPTAVVPLTGDVRLVLDQGALARRVAARADTLAVTPDASTPSRRIGDAPADGGMSVVTGGSLAPLALLRAEVSPATVDGVALQATHVATVPGFAYVSYALAGAPRRGAVDVFDLRQSTPRLVAQLELPRTDVNALAVAGSTLWLAGADTADDGRGRAVLLAVRLAGAIPTTDVRTVVVPSRAATGVAVGDGRVYVTSGNGGTPAGGLTVLDAGTLAEVGGDAFDDARDVTFAEGRAVVAQGTPGRLRAYAPASLAAPTLLDLGGGANADAKASVSVSEGYAYVTTGDGGLTVVDLARNDIVGRLARPVAPEGRDAADWVTNGVVAFSGLIFAANGGGGIEMALYDTQRGTYRLMSLGTLTFEDGASANHVGLDFSTGVLLVASGRGGLKIVEALPID